MAAARLPVFPTRQTLQVMKVKLTGAKKGHSLLKKKADALSMRLRALLKNILEAKEHVGAAFRDGNFALAEVKYAAGDIKPMVIESVGSAEVRESHSPPHPTRRPHLRHDPERSLPAPLPPLFASGAACALAAAPWRISPGPLARPATAFRLYAHPLLRRNESKYESII
jgi:hypothetical protein